MKEICIFGDSWSYQSFEKAPDLQEVPGSLTFQKMFAEHDIIAQNFSQQGCSNADILLQMKQCIEPIDRSECVIVFQTDPIRDIVHRHTWKFIDSFDYSKFSSILDIAKYLLVKFYNGVADIQQQTKTPVVLVGGLSCLYAEAVPSNIHAFSKSWTELLSPGFVDCFFEWTDFVELLAFKMENIDDLVEIKDQISVKNYVWRTSDYFGWCHPSDLGYTTMFHSLLQYIKDIK